MSEELVSFTEIITLQAFLGAPVYAGAVAVWGFSLWRTWSIRVGLTIMSCLVLFLLALALSLVLWAFWSPAVDLMAFEFVNVPALISVAIVTPLAFWVALLSKRWE